MTLKISDYMENWNFHTMLEEMSNGIHALENSLQFLIKLNIHLSYNLVTLLLGIYPREIIVLVYKKINR